MVPCRGLHGLSLQAMEPGAWVTPTAKTTSPSRDPKSPEAPESAQSEEEVDELSLIDHNEIMARLTLKQEVSSLQALRLQSLARDEGGGPRGGRSLEARQTERAT